MHTTPATAVVWTSGPATTWQFAEPSVKQALVPMFTAADAVTEEAVAASLDRPFELDLGRGMELWWWRGECVCVCVCGCAVGLWQVGAA